MNTLKFGNGEWYGKKDTILAYNDENSNFKPLPFSFDRDTLATRVNKDGLIETVGSGEPRIDYKDDSKGALLLEPSRSNLIQHSEAFDSSYWIKDGTVVTSNSVISPNGSLNADLLTANNGSHINVYKGIPTSSNNYTYSVFLKKGNTNIIQPYIFEVGIGFKTISTINFDNETATITVGDVSLEKYSNGWFKVSMTLDLTSAVGFTFGIFTESTIGTRNVYAWGAQLEQGSYATSYIPTQGGAVTRVADSCEQTPPSGIIGQTEGTVLFDYIPFDVSVSTSEDTIPLAISNNGSPSNAIFLNDYNGSLDLNINLGGVNQAKIQFSSLVAEQRFKIGFAYSLNDLVLYVNGIQIGIDTSLSLPTCNEIKLNGFTSNVHINKINVNDLKLYNTRLSNAELQALTT